MRTMKKIILILIAGLLPMGLVAQQEKANSHFGISIEGGVSHFFLGGDLSPVNGYTTPQIGGGGGAALYYEVEYKHFLFRTGFGVDYTINRSLFAPQEYMTGIAEYPGMSYHYAFPRYIESTHYGVGYVPILFGGGFKKVFFLVGAKIGVLPFGTSTSQNVETKIYATDPDIVDPMQGLYTHQMGSYSYQGAKTSLQLNQFNVMGSFEVGLNLDSKIWKASDEQKQGSRESRQKGKKAKRKPMNRADYYRKLHQKKSFKDCLHYRLSLFVDYGLLNMLPSNRPTEELVAFNGITDITPHSVYSIPAHRDAILHNCMVGIKFAIQYEVPHKAPKKGNMATPYIVTYVKDEVSDKPLAGATVTTQAVVPEGKKPKKPVTKTTDTKHGRVQKAYPAGEYTISATKSGYFPVEPFRFTHRDEYDTLRLAMYPEKTYHSQPVDAKSGRAIAARVTIYDEEGQVVKQTDVDSANTITSKIDDRKQYSICASAQGYRDTCLLLSSAENLQLLALEPLEVKQFVLRNLFFATNKTKILPSSEPALQELYLMLRDNPTIRIRIIGHTDDVGKNDYNQRLSEGRSASVKKEMVARGIDPKRIETTGRGETDPIVANDSDNHRQMNRRVEIVILDK